MITKPTVFILGAGASCDYGYPTGIKFIHEIRKQLEFERFLFTALKSLYGKNDKETASLLLHNI